MSETRNIIGDETAETNRTVGIPGGYTFHAPINGYPDGAKALTVCAVRLGDHAHIEVCTGHAITPERDPDFTQIVACPGIAGRLVMQWGFWLLFRDVVAAHPGVHVVEVERPRKRQLDRYAEGHGV